MIRNQLDCIALHVCIECVFICASYILCTPSILFIWPFYFVYKELPKKSEKNFRFSTITLLIAVECYGLYVDIWQHETACNLNLIKCFLNLNKGNTV